MRTYRCFILNEIGLVACRQDIDAPDDNAALEEGWRRVTTHQNEHLPATFGLELWLGLTPVFTTRDDVPNLTNRFNAAVPLQAAATLVL